MTPGRPLRRFVALCGLLVSLGSFTACPHRVSRPPDGPTEPGPILSRFAERSHALKSLSGMLSLEVWRGDERVRLRQLLLVQPPNRIRVDTLSPFDQPLAMMASDGQIVTIYSIEKQRFEQGPATQDHLARLLRLPLTGEELAAIMAGGVPIPTGAVTTLDWDDETGVWVLGVAVRESGRRQRIAVEPAAFRVVELRTWQNEQLVFDPSPHALRGPRGAPPGRRSLRGPHRQRRAAAGRFHHPCAPRHSGQPPLKLCSRLWGMGSTLARPTGAAWRER